MPALLGLLCYYIAQQVSLFNNLRMFACIAHTKIVSNLQQNSWNQGKKQKLLLSIKTGPS